MKKEYEKRPVATKVIRENFRRALERKMNKLMSEGYVPTGGISTHMNTLTKPVLGIDSQEYTQTMVKYDDFEIWVKDTDEDRAALTDEQERQSLTKQLESLKKSLVKDLHKIKKLQEKIAKYEAKANPVKKTFLSELNAPAYASLADSNKKELLKQTEKVTPIKAQYKKLEQQIITLDNRLEPYYKANPLITKDILLSSR